MIIISYNLNNLSVNENNGVLLNIISKFSKGFNIVHFNARSLNSLKLDYIRDIFSDSNIHAICVTETWFCEDVQDVYLNIPNYQLFRNDRAGKNRDNRVRRNNGGGVAIYIKQSLKARVIGMSKNSKVEYLNVELGDSSCKVLVSCVYNPHRNNSLNDFFNEFVPFVTEYEHIVLCGDFNVNVLNIDNVSSDFLNSVALTGLSIVNSVAPTRFGKNSPPSLLDMFLVSNKSIVNHFDQISFISDHDLIFSSFDIQLTHSTITTSFSFRNFKAIDFPSLYNELMSTDWQSCTLADTVDDELFVLSSEIKRIFDKFVPIKTVNSKKSTCPWFRKLKYFILI